MQKRSFRKNVFNQTAILADLDQIYTKNMQENITHPASFASNLWITATQTPIFAFATLNFPSPASP